MDELTRVAKDKLSQRAKRVLLLSSTVPGQNGVGASILKDLCKLYPRDSICACITDSQSEANYRASEITGFPILETGGCGWRMYGSRVGRVLRWPVQYLKNSFQRTPISGSLRLTTSKYQETWLLCELVARSLGLRKMVVKLRHMSEKLCVFFGAGWMAHGR